MQTAAGQRPLQQTLREMRMDQFLTLVWLSAGDRDGPGRGAEELNSRDLHLVNELIGMGLARLDHGWRKSRWYRLSEDGWQAFANVSA